MPMLRFRGISAEDLVSMSTPLLDDLEKIIGCPRDYFVLEVNENRCVFDGQFIPPAPTIEILWFSRGQAVQDQVAEAVFQQFVKKNIEPEIYFLPLQEENYYENGKHL